VLLLAGQTALPLPVLGLAQVDSEPILCGFIGRPSVLVDITAAPGSSFRNDIGGSLRSFRARTVGVCLSGRGKSANAGRCRREAQPAGLQGKTTRLAAARKSAVAGGVECRIQVVQGLVDELQFDAPSSWKGLTKFPPPQPSTPRRFPGEPRRVSVAPSKAIAGEYAFQSRRAAEVRAG